MSMKTIRFGKAFKWLGVVFITSLFFIGSLNAWQLAIKHVTRSKKWAVTALVYHRFGDGRYPSTNTTIDVFEQQLKWLKQNGYISITASEALLMANKKEGKYVCITIDDGYKSFKENGLPLLKKYGMKSTLFVNTESVGWGDYLTWEELKQVQDDGVEVGNHSHSHAYFVSRPEGDRLLYFESDLVLSEKLFVRHLGTKPLTYAYPYGEFSGDMMEMLKNKGYKLAFAQNSGVWNETTTRWAIPRFPMAGRLSMEQFESKMKMQPFKVEQQPESPVLLNGFNKLEMFFRYDIKDYPGSVNCFVNGQPCELSDAGEGLICLKVKVPSGRRRNMVTLTTRNKNGRWCWYSCLFINIEAKE